MQFISTNKYSSAHPAQKTQGQMAFVENKTLRHVAISC